MADLQASFPETVRDRVKALIRQVMVEADGRVVVEDSWEPVVQEELCRNGDAQGADACVRTTLVAGGGNRTLMGLSLAGCRTARNVSACLEAVPHEWIRVK